VAGARRGRTISRSAWMDSRRRKNREKHNYSIKKEKGRNKETRRD
jgi:hypothetical protein